MKVAPRLKDTRVDLLEILGNHLMTDVPAAKFAMETWMMELGTDGSPVWGHPPDREAIEGDKMACGTVGCAIGHAQYLPEFQKAGLRFNLAGIPVYAPKLPAGKAIDNSNDVGWANTNFIGLEKLFALDSSDDIYYLFDAKRYAKRFRHNPEFVGRRILKFIKDGKVTSTRYAE